MPRKKSDHEDFIPRKENAGPVKVRRGFRLMEVNRFKLLTAYAKKNDSYKYGLPQLDDVPHVHWFRDVNDKNGQPQKYATMAVGHTHEIVVDWSRTQNVEVTYEDGTKQMFMDQPVVICKPAVKENRYIIDPSRPAVKKIEPVSWFRNPMLGDDPRHHILGDKVIDNHTHQIVYLDTEELTFQKIQEIRVRNRAEIAANTTPAMGGVDQASRLTQMGNPSQAVMNALREAPPEEQGTE